MNIWIRPLIWKIISNIKFIGLHSELSHLNPFICTRGSSGFLVNQDYDVFESHNNLHKLYVFSIVFNHGKDSKYEVTSESWGLGFAALYQPFVDS